MAASLASARSPLQRLGLLALVFAFALQAYFVQTHIHAQLAQPQVKVVSVEDTGGSLPGDPLDPTTCKLCREIVTTGVAVTPAMPAFLLLLDWVATSIPVAQLRGPALPPESGWQSRAPPNL